MSPLDDELRVLLHSRAHALPTAPSPLPKIERLARHMRRTRVAASVAGSVLAVAAVAGAALSLRPDEDRRPEQVATATSEPAPAAPSAPGTAAPSAAGTAAPSAAAPGPTTAATATPPASPSGPAPALEALDPQRPWAYRGDVALTAGHELAALQAEWATVHPGATLTPLYGEIYASSGRSQITFFSTGGSGARWGVASSSDAGWTFLHDAPLAAHAVVLMAALRADEVPRLLIVTAPTGETIQYARDGHTFVTLHGPVAGVAYTPLEGNTSHDRVRVIKSSGALNAAGFDGPAPGAGAPSRATAGP